MKLSDEYKVLIYCLESLEAEGATRKVYEFNFNEETLKKINTKFTSDFSLKELEEVVKKSISNNYLEYMYFGEKMSSVRITDMGIGIARSKRKEFVAYSEKSFLTKLSDKVQAHSGLMSLIAIAVSFASLIITSCGK